MTKLKVAAVQMCSGVDQKVNAEAFERLVMEASKRGAIYIQTPEMTGLVQKDRAELMKVVRPEKDDLLLATAARLAKRWNLYLHIGSTPILCDDGRIANRSFLFGPDGAVICRYDKIHMFDVDLDHGESWRESALYAPGDEAIVANLPFGKLGFAICYDLRFPQLFRAEAKAGVQILTAPAAFTRQTGEAHWEILVRARAIENGAYMIAAAQGGVHDDGRETYGHSMIVDPWGRVVAMTGAAGEDIIVAELDLDTVLQARERVPNLKNERQFQLREMNVEGNAV